MQCIQADTLKLNHTWPSSPKLSYLVIRLTRKLINPKLRSLSAPPRTSLSNSRLSTLLDIVASSFPSMTSSSQGPSANSKCWRRHSLLRSSKSSRSWSWLAGISWSSWTPATISQWISALTICPQQWSLWPGRKLVLKRIDWCLLDCDLVNALIISPLITSLLFV